MAAAQVHPTAIIGDEVSLGEDVFVGPYCVVEGPVVLGDRVRLEAHAVVRGHTRIGADSRVYSFAALGYPPQDLKYAGETSYLEIGERASIREYVTLHPGTEGGGLVTTVGDDVLLMIGSHVAHDCWLGNRAILANNVALAGHVSVGHYTIIGGNSAVQQFVRIGDHAMIGGMSGVERDVVPYATVMGERAYLAGLNLVGLKRRGFSSAALRSLRQAYRDLFESGEGALQDRLEHVAERYGQDDAVQAMIAFMRAEPGRPLCQPRGSAGGDDS